MSYYSCFWFCSWLLLLCVFLSYHAHKLRLVSKSFMCMAHWPLFCFCILNEGFDQLPVSIPSHYYSLCLVDTSPPDVLIYLTCPFLPVGVSLWYTYYTIFIASDYTLAGTFTKRLLGFCREEKHVILKLAASGEMQPSLCCPANNISVLQHFSHIFKWGNVHTFGPFLWKWASLQIKSQFTNSGTNSRAQLQWNH